MKPCLRATMKNQDLVSNSKTASSFPKPTELVRISISLNYTLCCLVSIKNDPLLHKFKQIF